MSAHETHLQLVDKVNDAKTEAEREIASARLHGWRWGFESAGGEWNWMGADEHSMARFGDRPLCCGVLLDWEPA